MVDGGPGLEFQEIMELALCAELDRKSLENGE